MAALLLSLQAKRLQHAPANDAGRIGKLDLGIGKARRAEPMRDLVHPCKSRTAHHVAAHQVGGRQQHVLAIRAALEQRRPAVRAATPNAAPGCLGWTGCFVHVEWASMSGRPKHAQDWGGRV
ncbi:hypothetical protein D3C84_200450 [compost metagenome]